MRHRSLSLLVLAVVLGAPAPAQDIDAIFARYNTAVDPQNKVTSLPGLKLTARFELAAAGMSATMTIHQRPPKQILTIIELAGIGEMRQGSDGTTVWSSDPMGGPRILTGAEAASITDGGDLASLRRTRDLFTAIEGAGEGEVGGERCARLRLTWKSGRVTTECYSATSGLVIESAGKQATPQGEIDATTRMTDYRAVAGILLPHRVVTSLMGMEQVITITEVQAIALDAALFELPPAIRALRAP